MREDIIQEKIVTYDGEVKYRKYGKGDQLGKGAFGAVHELRHWNKRTDEFQSTAGKSIAKKKDPTELKEQKKKLINEIEIHRSLDHENIVKFEHYFEDKTNVYMILELCHSGSLHDMLKVRRRLLEIEVKTYTIALCRAVRYLHSKRIIHRDLKLGNILFKEITIPNTKGKGIQLKIADFGLATKLDYYSERKMTFCGTPNYIAPEMLINHDKNGHSFEVDIWAIGVIMFTLLFGAPPFQAPNNDIKGTYKRIKKCEFEFPKSEVPISNLAKDLIQRILVVNPDERLTLSMILKHPWLSGGQDSIPEFFEIETLKYVPSERFLKRYKILS